jgi:hypothetical protein
MESGRFSFVWQLVDRFPAVRSILDEHLSENGGELLPHPFFGDLTRWIVPAVHSDPSSKEYLTAKGLLDALEEGLKTGDDDVLNLIAVSFLENLPYRCEEGGDTRDLLGPTLRKELELQRGDQ